VVNRADARRLAQLKRVAVRVVDVPLSRAAQDGNLCADDNDERPERDANLASMLFQAWRQVYADARPESINVVRLDFDGITNLTFGTASRVLCFFLAAFRSIELKPCYVVVDRLLDTDNVSRRLAASLVQHKLVVVGRPVESSGVLAGWQLLGAAEAVAEHMRDDLWTRLQAHGGWIWGNHLTVDKTQTEESQEPGTGKDRRLSARRLEDLARARLIMRKVEDSYPYYRSVMLSEGNPRAS
jgi:hypothetical protein